jgi:hypothetical protein
MKASHLLRYSTLKQQEGESGADFVDREQREYIFLLNIGFITSVGVHVCDRRPSVRRVLWLTMHNRLYRRIKLQNGLLSAANTRANYLPHL